MTCQKVSAKIVSLAEKIVNKSNNSVEKYAEIVNNYPVTVMSFVIFISVTLTSISLSITVFPTFDDPKLGFQTQGTEYSGRVTSFKNLDKETSIYPDQSKEFYRQYISYKSRKKRNTISDDLVSSNHNQSDKSCDDQPKNFNRIDLFSQLVLQYQSSDDLFTAQGFKELCKFQNQINQLLLTFNGLSETWQSLSVANYFACYLKKKTCLDINADELNRIKDNLTYCFRYKESIFNCNELSKKFSTSSSLKICQQIPSTCNSEFYYNIFEFILSKEFLIPNSESGKFVAIFLPILQYDNMELLSNPQNVSVKEFIDLHNEIRRYSSNFMRRSKLVGEAFGAKFQMFREYMLKDCVDLIISLALVSIIIFFYSGSIFYTLAVLITLLFSFGLAYFAYTLIFRIPFFPHMNILVCILLIGVGADDTFVFHHIYYLYKKSNERIFTLKDISEAFSNAAVSMFVTSATTAASFYANYYSDIMVIKSFSIFAGSLMLANYLLVISWLPASLIFFDRHLTPIYYKFCSKKYLKLMYKVQLYCMFVPKTIFLETIMPWLVKKLRVLWVVLLSLGFIGSLVVIFYKPGLQLSKRNLFKMFKDGNSFEWYDDQCAYQFDFRLSKYQQPQGLALVWGYTPTDNIKTMDPYDSGSLVLDASFKMNLKILKQIGQICEKIDNANYTNTHTHQLCFPKLFFQWSSEFICNNSTATTTTITTTNPITITNTTTTTNTTTNTTTTTNTATAAATCCNYQSYSFDEAKLGHCLALASEKNSLVEYGGPLFRTGTFDVVGFVLFFDSIFTSPLTYDVFGKYLDDIDEDVKKSLSASNESSVRNGWIMTTNYNIMMLHDLQTSLVHGTPISVIISVIAASVIVILMTKNFLLTIFALLSVIAVTSVTVACLVLMNWSFNFVEATICILTVGLSFDFTLHYLVGYQLAPFGTRDEKVFATLTYVGLPVLLSALTTFLAGCAMLPSTTILFYQTGIFMVLVSFISWLYSSLFFLSLLSLFGPEDGSCLDYHFICLSRRRPSVALQGALELPIVNQINHN